MTSTVTSLAGVPVLVCEAHGPALDERGALDLIGDAVHHGVEWVAVPVSRWEALAERLAEPGRAAATS